MKRKNLVTRMVVGAIYGGLIGWGFSFLINSAFLPQSCALLGAFCLSRSFSLSIAAVLSQFLSGCAALSFALNFALSLTLTSNALAIILGFTLSSIIAVITYFISNVFLGLMLAIFFWLSGEKSLPIIFLKNLANHKNTTPEKLIDEHIAWLFTLLNVLMSFLPQFHVSAKTITKGEIKQRAWDVRLIVALSYRLSEFFPEDWDRWQPEMECMIAFRKSQQSKGISHRLISLITFYHLCHFAFHIGIDKVFILATRRTTR